MPLPADATEFVDAPTIDPLGWVAFKLVLLGDHCVKSSSTISVIMPHGDFKMSFVFSVNGRKKHKKNSKKEKKMFVNINHAGDGYLLG